MKRRSLNIFLVLFLFLGFSSCGSDDDGNQIAPAPAPVTPTPTPLEPGDLHSGLLSDLRLYVANMSFDESTSFVFTEFFYQKTITKVVGGFFGGYRWVTKNMYRSKTWTGSTYIVNHDFGHSFEAVRDGLLQIIDNTVSHRQSDQCLWELTTANSDVYGIDVCKSMIANPVFKYSYGPHFPKKEYYLVY